MAHDRPPYDDWAAYIDRVVRAAATPTQRVLEVGCGTGAMTSRLQAMGWDMVGLDASPDMIEIAKETQPPGPRFLSMRLPDPQFQELGTFSAAIACFDTVNYLSQPGDLKTVFGQIGHSLLPGGIFVFDTNTRFKLETLFGRYHSGDDFQEFAYVWRNRYEASERSCHIDLTFFIPTSEGLYERFLEHHVERWFLRSEIEDALAAGGMSLDRITVAYTEQPVQVDTPRVTWIARKTDSVDGQGDMQ
ncbi:class I SAM-dependent DNA methyltransferase [Geodermatophilus sp. SYSU D01062]